MRSEKKKHTRIKKKQYGNKTKANSAHKERTLSGILHKLFFFGYPMSSWSG